MARSDKTDIGAWPHAPGSGLKVPYGTTSPKAGWLGNLAHIKEYVNDLLAAFRVAAGHTHTGVDGDGPKIVLTTGVTGTLPVANGGTGAATATAGFDALAPLTTLGDTLYGGAAGTGTRLAGNTTTTRKFLRQTGDGAASAAPAWDTVTKTDVGLSAVENTALSTWTGSDNLTTVKGLTAASTTVTANTNSLTPNSAEVNVGVAIVPKGTGALTADVPNGISTGGNARGAYAVDLQTDRSSAAQVASGSRAVISGGGAHTASGDYSVVGGGNTNTASGSSSVVAGGASNTASNTSASVAGGGGNAASGNYSTIGGGSSNTVSGSYATVPGGYYGSAYLYGQESCASGAFNSVDGSAQRSVLVVRKQTSNATQGELSLDGSGTRAVLPSGKAWRFRIELVASQAAGAAGTVGDTYAVTAVGTIKNVAGTTALVGSVTQSDETADAAAATWDLVVSADDTNDALVVKVTGEASKTIRWVATIYLTEVAFA